MTETEQTTILPDGSQIKTITSYFTNEQGQQVKRVRQIKRTKIIKKVNKKVEARKKWRKFGDCAGLSAGPEQGITSICDEIFIEPPELPESTFSDSSVKANIVCINCKRKGHWTSKCPLPIRKELIDQMFDRKPDKYRPPVKPEDVYQASKFGDTAAVRVSNLSMDTTEVELGDLFRPFGKVQRIRVVRDKHTQDSRGFAFVNFYNHADAQRAIDSLSGKGLDHSILYLEWSKPK